MTLAILLHASATTAQYLLTVTEHRPTPILSASNPPGQGMAPMDCIVFNPSYIPSSGSFNQTGLLVRMCCGKQCIGHGRRIAHRTELSSAAPEQIGFAPCNLETGVCGDAYPSETFNLDPSSDSEDPRAFYYPETQNYYNFYYRQVNLPVGKQRCPEKNPQCRVRLARTRTPLNASSWVPIGTYPWHRNGCCAMRPKGERSYCIWGEGPDPFPGLGVSYTTDIDSGVFTRASWSAAPGVDSPLSSDRQWLLPLGAAQEEIKLEAGSHMVRLTSGDWLHFYAAATPGWVPNGNYTAGFLILDGSDPTRIVQRSGPHILVPRFDYETLCDGAAGCKYRGERKNVIFLCSATLLSPTRPSEAAHGEDLAVDRVRLFFGGGDGNVGTALVEVRRQSAGAS